MALARSDLQKLAEMRLREARTLFEAGYYAGAYYLASYAVELGLKACIAKQFKAEAIPDWKFFRDTRTHKMPELVGLCGLEVVLTTARSADEKFDAYWTAVANWTVDSRYEDRPKLSHRS